MLEVKIRTLQGNREWLCHSDDLSIADLKRELYDASGTDSLSGLSLPEPDRQNLVYNGRCLEAGKLVENGFQSGESIVILSLPDSPVQGAQLAPKVPDEERIQEEITSYAKKHGLEECLNNEEVNSATPSSSVLPTTDRPEIRMDQLQEIMDALEETMSQATPLDDSADIEEIEIPEPTETNIQGISQMMNIPIATARKALLLNRNNPSEALTWILEHQEDDDFHTPVSDETIRSIYSSVSRPSNETTASAVLERVMEMGYSEEQARDALQRTREVLEMAAEYLIGTSGTNRGEASSSIDGPQSTEEAPVLSSTGITQETDAQPSEEVPEEVPPSETEGEELINAFDDEFLGLEEMEAQLTEQDENALLLQIRQILDDQTTETELPQNVMEALNTMANNPEEIRTQLLELLRERIVVRSLLNIVEDDPDAPGPSGESSEEAS